MDLSRLMLFAGRFVALLFLALLFIPVFPAQSASAEKPGGEGLVSVEVRVPKSQRFWPFDKPRSLMAPPGFEISVFAAGLGRPRIMAVGPDGVIYVSISREDRILALPDRDGDGVADDKIVFAEDLQKPHGITFRNGEMVVAETGRLITLKDTDGDLKADKKKIISTDIPAGGGHWTRSIVAGPDGTLYVSVGSTCNVCEEDDFRRATVLWFWPDGGAANIYASGLRNTVGLALHPETNEIWGVDNGRDWLGDNLPPEELNRITSGGNYGWPYCYGANVPDPDLGSKRKCKGAVPPEVEMQAHSAPLGLAFGFELDFPHPYKDILYVAFHGSWNRSIPTGYKLVGIPFNEGKPSGTPFDFVTGWLLKGEPWGRPVSPLAGPDGALYLTDDFAGAIYRIAPLRDQALTVGPAGGGI